MRNFGGDIDKKWGIASSLSEICLIYLTIFCCTTWSYYFSRRFFMPSYFFFHRLMTKPKSSINSLRWIENSFTFLVAIVGEKRIFFARNLLYFIKTLAIAFLLLLLSSSGDAFCIRPLNFRVHFAHKLNLLTLRRKFIRGSIIDVLSILCGPINRRIEMKSSH